MRRFSRDQFICRVRPLDWKAVSDQCFHVDLAIGKKFEKRFHVARFSPAHITDGIVDAFLFVSSVVTSGTIGARNPKVEFLLVVRPTVEFHTDRTNRHNYSAIPGYFGGQIDWV